MKEKSNLLKIYEERFGDITGFDNLKKDAVGDYDIDKEFFDYLTYQRGGKSFSDAQVAAIKYNMYKHMRIIAGAGSGKTETICAKAAYFVNVNKIPESRICMITFTNNAANEMKNRVNNFLGTDKSDIMIGTFHSIFIRLYNHIKAKFPGLNDFGITGDNVEQGEFLYKKELNKLIKDYDLSDFNDYGEKKLFDRISFWTNSGYNLADMVDNIKKYFDDYFDTKSKSNSKVSERFNSMMIQLEEIRKEKRIVIFDDFLINFYNILDSHKEARTLIQNKFDYIFVDEFQDTNQLQINILKLICPCDSNEKTKSIRYSIQKK